MLLDTGRMQKEVNEGCTVPYHEGEDTTVRKLTVTIAALLALAFVAGTASADNVTDAMAAASAAYGSGDLKETSTKLQTALVAVNQLLIDALVAALPEPPTGWTAGEPEGIDVSSIGAGFFATLVVERPYTTPDGTRIDMTIAANSPMLAGLRMFVSNPMMASMAGQSGMTTATVCGFDAIKQYGDGTFETNVLAGNATLITFRGHQASDEAHIDTLSGATDCATIVDIVE
jgi:hypothetical protein